MLFKGLENKHQVDKTYYQRSEPVVYLESPESTSCRSFKNGVYVFAAVLTAILLVHGVYTNLYYQRETGLDFDNDLLSIFYQDTDTEFTIDIPGLNCGGIMPAENLCISSGDFHLISPKGTPPLEWSNIPLETKEFILALRVMPVGKDYWDYNWMLYKIPASVSSLDEGAGFEDRAPPVGLSVGVGHEQDVLAPIFGYLPPCGHGPGIHAYHFVLFALREELDVQLVESLGLNTWGSNLIEYALNQTVTPDNLPLVIDTSVDFYVCHCSVEPCVPTDLCPNWPNISGELVNNSNDLEWNG